LICSWSDDAQLASYLSQRTATPGRAHIIAHTHIPSGDRFGRVSVIPHDPEAFARAIYSELHQADEAGADLIVVEELPNGPEWRAVRDRLNRAAR
jgi:L-threonylcarbamoyladenylate synthase